jgi:hypothetical protein
MVVDNLTMLMVADHYGRLYAWSYLALFHVMQNFVIVTRLAVLLTKLLSSPSSLELSLEGK